MTTSVDSIVRDPETCTRIFIAAMTHKTEVQERCKKIAAEREALESKVGDLQTEKQNLERGARATKIGTANYDESVLMSLLKAAEERLDKGYSDGAKVAKQLITYVLKMMNHRVRATKAQSSSAGKQRKPVRLFHRITKRTVKVYDNIKAFTEDQGVDYHKTTKSFRDTPLEPISCEGDLMALPMR